MSLSQERLRNIVFELASGPAHEKVRALVYELIVNGLGASSTELDFECPVPEFHDLRHTSASLMLLRGAKPKVISEALGHSSVAFTVDVHSHIIEGMQSDAMVLLDEVLPVARNGMPHRINVKLASNQTTVLSKN